MTTVAALRHVAFEDLGILEDLFAARGWQVNYIESPVADWAAFDPLAPDLLVILGGPIGANDGAAYPFLKSEYAALEKRLTSRRPLLGLCLGAQLIAHTLGARVYPAATKEIGWKPLLLAHDAQASPLAHLDGPMFHWHGDTFDLPRDAVLLASTDACPHQAFAWGKATLAFQCHPEVRARDLEKWFVGHTAELAATPGVSLQALRADTARYGADLEARGKRCFEEWLTNIPL